ncbi:EF-hand domain-containing protein (plasmid) [Streptomyces sp. NBC_01426]|uniref:EF-hand domain-containing protein n=1 Tax=Streptomyces sp. NBC_01426 TaxID=2975866 RepID=UPI002E3004AB|nr:EF-hand domain-containing protein [Streptomyces sp. NBC_01426]
MNTAIGVLDQKLGRAFAMLDVDGDGNLREDDLLSLSNRLAAAFDMSGDATKIARLRNAFTQLWTHDLSTMDADQDGLLDRAEFMSGMKKAVANDREGILQRLSVMVDAWMDICDTDGNGLIDEDEFQTMYIKSLGASPEDLKVAFAKLDTDGDGTLGREEIRRATEEYYTSEDPKAPGNWLFGAL